MCYSFFAPFISHIKSFVAFSASDACCLPAVCPPKSHRIHETRQRNTRPPNRATTRCFKEVATTQSRVCIPHKIRRSCHCRVSALLVSKASTYIARILAVNPLLARRTRLWARDASVLVENLPEHSLLYRTATRIAQNCRVPC